MYIKIATTRQIGTVKVANKLEPEPSFLAVVVGFVGAFAITLKF
jgi:hypothetical protein